MQTFDSLQLIFVIGAYKVGGFITGDFMGITRDSDNYSDDAGATGEVSRSATNDKHGSVIFRLKHESPANAALSGMIILDEISKSLVMPISVTDLSGNDVVVGAEGWFLRYPDGSFSNVAGRQLEYTIRIADMDVFYGGNN